MKEVKTPNKPLAIYYAIVLLVLMLLNFVLVPWMSERQVKEVEYGTFMSKTEDKAPAPAAAAHAIVFSHFFITAPSYPDPATGN